MSRYAHSRHHKGTEYKKFKFYKHLKFYLIFVGFMFFMKVFMNSDANFYPLAFWWGFGLVIHYLRTFGWDGNMTMAKSAREELYERRYDLPTEPEKEEFVELKQPQKAWRDRDLV